MLTRLQIDGFKNLKGVDLRFGALTCIAGRNGVGKSNLFDAIAFLGDLASMPLLKAAVRVRGTGGRLAGVRHIFGHYASDTPRISFVAEMVVPRQVLDDFDRSASATATCLRYSIRLALKSGGADSDAGESLYIESERLEALSLEHATAAMHFGPSKAWCKRYLLGPGNRTTPFIATRDGAITLFGDKGSKGRPPAAPASKTPQTVLSGVNSSTHPTALAARRELQSWHLLQLEPTALRAPDEYNGDKSISATGQHLPNALRRIGCQFQLANLLSELIPGVISVEVDSDEARQQRTLQVRMRDRQLYDASALSDGTLRFIALGLLGLDPRASGLVCLEEPENGIHPQRIPDMMLLVGQLAEDLTDVESGEGDDPSVGPRQVIVNTHSPLVVGELDANDLLIAETLRQRGQEWISFKPLRDTWRAGNLAITDLVSPGEIQEYLGASTSVSAAPTPSALYGRSPRRRAVKDHLPSDLFGG